MTNLTFALGIGTALQVLMVVIGHVMPSLQAAGLFPIEIGRAHV